MTKVLAKLDRDGMKPGWGVVRDWIIAVGMVIVAIVLVAVCGGDSPEQRVFDERCEQRCRVESGERQHGSDQAKCICVAKGDVLIEYEIEVP